MAEANTMAVTARDRAGKGAARAERRAGRIPAVIYGGKADPVMRTLKEGLYPSALHQLALGAAATPGVDPSRRIEPR